MSNIKYNPFRQFCMQKWLLRRMYREENKNV